MFWYLKSGSRCSGVWDSMICACCERTYLYQNQYSYKYHSPCSNAVLGYILERRAIHQNLSLQNSIARVYVARSAPSLLCCARQETRRERHSGCLPS